MSGMFDKTVSALCYEIARGHARYGYAVPPYNDVVRFVSGQFGRMPRFLAVPMRVATVFFGGATLFKGGLFYRLTPPQRMIQVERWTNSSLGPCRDLIRFYRSLVLLALYSRPVGRRH
jgi:hypothetical protein